MYVKIRSYIGCVVSKCHHLFQIMEQKMIKDIIVNFINKYPDVKKEASHLGIKVEDISIYDFFVLYDKVMETEDMVHILETYICQKFETKESFVHDTKLGFLFGLKIEDLSLSELQEVNYDVLEKISNHFHLDFKVISVVD